MVTMQREGAVATSLGVGGESTSTCGPGNVHTFNPSMQNGA